MSSATHEDAHGPDLQRPLIWAAVVVVLFCSVAFYLVRRGLKVAAARPPVATGVPEATESRAVRTVEVAHGERIRFASRFERGQRRMGFRLRANAAGEQGKVFRLSWAKQLEPDKFAQFKRANALHREARRRGFRRLEVVVAGKLHWAQKL